MKASRGILVIDKPAGPTSHDIVARMRRILGMHRIGHCGTLDPLATGVLVLCFGTYTRLSEAIAETDKEYRVRLRLGATSDTGDAEGVIEPLAGMRIPSEDEVEAVLVRFRGEIRQIPPAYSAVKVEGVRSYRLARRNKAVEIPARPVRIKELEVLKCDYPEFKMRVVCSKGTYIRSLARDIGDALGCGAYVSELRRTRVGSLDLSVAVNVEEVQMAVAGRRLGEILVPTARALSSLPAVMLTPLEAKKFLQGATVATESVCEAASNTGVEEENLETCAVYDEAKRLCGLGFWVGGSRSRLRPAKVLLPGGVEE